MEILLTSDHINSSNFQPMYKYEFVKIKLQSGFFKSRPAENYQDIINDYAKKGWRFVQIFAPATSGYGSSSYFELIFEKKE